MKTVADLHLHSTHSDGKLSVPEIAQVAQSRNLMALSITDHDTIDAYLQPIPDSLADILIPGVELSVQDKGRAIHLLIYGFSLSNPRISHWLARCQAAREIRFSAMLDALDLKGWHVREAAHNASDKTSGGLARLVVSLGYVRYVDTVFKEVLHHEGNQHLGYSVFPSLSDVLADLRNEDLVTVLAHPGFEFLERMEDLSRYFSSGLDGLEVIHPSHNRRMRLVYKKLCQDHGKLIFGGSDFHGPGYSAQGIGQMGLDMNQWRNLEHRLKPRNGTDA